MSVSTAAPMTPRVVSEGAGGSGRASGTSASGTEGAPRGDLAVTAR
jgi:hypothetical protein